MKAQQAFSITFLGLFLGCIVKPYAQNCVITASSVNVCTSGVQLAVPVTCQNFNNVGSLALTMRFDTTVLSYMGYQNASPLLTNGFFLITSLGNEIRASYFYFSPISITSGVLYELLFEYKGGSSSLAWSTFSQGDCLITDLATQEIPTTFVDGQVQSFQPQVFQLSGGGTYCPSDTGLMFILSGSEVNTNYKLYLNDSIMVAQQYGNGSPIIFPPQTQPGRYCVKATSDNCPDSLWQMMLGYADLVIAPAVQVISQPTDMVAAYGGNASFTVLADHADQYQWEVSADAGLTFSPLSDGGEYEGAQSNNLRLSWADTSMNGYAYRCRMTDLCGQLSYTDTSLLSVSDTVIALRLQLYLQGPYHSNGVMRTDLFSYLPNQQPYSASPWLYSGDDVIQGSLAGTVDWILVSLLDTAHVVVGRRAGLLMLDGRVRDVDGDFNLQFSGVRAGPYYVMVDHRNHMPVMSAGQHLIPDTVYVNFGDTSAVPVTGGSGRAMAELDNGRYGLLAGDINKDGSLIYSGPQNDRTLIFQQLMQVTGTTIITSTATGYYNGDLNMNGILQYSGPSNDPAVIVGNIIQKTGSTAVTTIYISPGPSGTLP